MGPVPGGVVLKLGTEIPNRSPCGETGANGSRRFCVILAQARDRFVARAMTCAVGTIREMNWDRLFVSTVIGASIVSMVLLVLALLWPG
jgi:hypothetical protein